MAWWEEFKAALLVYISIQGHQGVYQIRELAGTLPPAAVPITAHMEQKATKFIVPAAPQRNTPATTRVMLNAGLRPIKSHEMPQNEAPRMRPT